MKKIIYVCVGIFLGMLTVQAEEINAVYFNPSRLGSYETLRVTDSLRTNADLNVGSMTLEVDSTDGTINVVSSNATPINDKTVNYYFSGENSSGYDGINAEYATIYMSGSNFYLEKMEIRGNGQATFSNNSSIAQFGADAQTDVGGELRAEDNFNASNTDVYVETDFTLGNNKIPAPTTCGNGGMAWVQRTDKQGNTHKVLGCGTACACTNGQINNHCGPTGSGLCCQCQDCSWSTSYCCNGGTKNSKGWCCQGAAVTNPRCYTYHITEKTVTTWSGDEARRNCTGNWINVDCPITGFCPTTGADANKSCYRISPLSTAAKMCKRIKYTCTAEPIP